MKDLNITRKIDEIGRVVLPIEVRLMLSLAEKDSVSFYLSSDEKALILKKCERLCCSCQSKSELKSLQNGKYICRDCLARVLD